MEPAELLSEFVFGKVRKEGQVRRHRGQTTNLFPSHLLAVKLSGESINDRVSSTTYERRVVYYVARIIFVVTNVHVRASKPKL